MMNINAMTTNSMNEEISSRFGMPVGGHRCLGVLGFCATRQESVDFTTPVIDRTRPTATTAATKGHLGLIAYVPGSNAWSPPIC